MVKREREMCVFCKKGKDNIDHSISVYRTTKDWFVELENRVKDRIKRI